MSQTKLNKEFIVTARKWRPMSFSDIVGQDHISTTIKNAIKSNRIHHAFLFSGPRGVGKTTTARIFARAVNCTSPVDAEPCNECESCRNAIEGRSIDIIEIDGASNNSVDDVRNLRENAKYPPVSSKYKLYIIDEVHMLSKAAFNALLKTLEEPPPHLLFVFATTESHKMPATIISRCQRFNFKRMEISDIIRRIKYIASQESVRIDDESLMTIAKKADGSMRDAQSIYDQVVAFCGMEIIYSEMSNALHLIDTDFFFNISSAIKSKDIEKMFTLATEVISKGYDLQECLGGMIEHFRNLLTICVTGSTSLIDSSEAYLERYLAEASAFNKSDLIRFIKHLSDVEQSFKYSPQPRIKFEMTLVQLASMDSAVEIQDLINEIKGLEGKFGSDSIRRTIPKPIPKTIEKPISKPSDKPYPVQENPENATTKYPPPMPNEPKIKADTEKNKEVTQATPEIKQAPAENRSTSAGRPKVISAQELEVRWNEFLSKYAKGENGLSILSETLAKFLNGEIILHSAQSFVIENLKRKKQMIMDAANDFYGGRIQIRLLLDEEFDQSKLAETRTEPIDEPAPAIPASNIEPENKLNEGNSSTESSIDTKREAEELHPVEKKIVELFDAVEVSKRH